MFHSALYKEGGRNLMNDNPINNYTTGGEFWRDNAVKYGIDEAAVICNNYLSMQLQYELPYAEKQFCRQIFTAMYEATADKVCFAKLVYPYDFKTANDRSETSYYHKNRDMNQECARAIDEAIDASCYKTNYYNLELAVMSVVGGHGFNRVNTVLAHQIQKHEHDGRYSEANKKWARSFAIHENSHTFLRSHAILVEDFATYTRKLYTELDAERFALLGNEEHGYSNIGYEITRSIMFSDTQGYCIAHNPGAVNPYVCWQFTEENNHRDYYWGIYGEQQDAIDGYNARLFVKFK
jgi:hypothetical protein